MNKTILVVALFFIGLSGISAQEWITNFDEARQSAKETDKTIVMVFQGSDWCAPCIKLEKEIWNSEIFRDYADKHYVMLKLDFPRRRQNKLSEEQQNHNNELAEKYNEGAGFPLVVLLDKTGNVLGKTGYKNITPEAYIELLNSFVPAQ